MDAQYYVGCDLGGTNIKAGLVDLLSGQVIASKNTKTLSYEGHEAVIRRMADLIMSLVAEAGFEWDQIGGIGVSAPGRLDLEKGETIFITNFPGHWINVPLKATLEEYLHVPVYILNDVRAITYGEWAFGAGKGVDCMLCFAIGTGIGGGVVMNNQLVLTQGGTAGELGHITIDIHGPICGCGNNGCVETLASGPAIAAMGLKAVVQGQKTIIGEMVNYDLNKITAHVIAKAAEAGDEVALSIWNEVGSNIGVAVINAALVVGPKRVVITGGVAAAGELLLHPIRETLRKRMIVMPADKIEIVQGSLGDNAGIIGLAVWAAHGGGLN
ncbi:MAG TPA: ROK family protein [Anaerolineaceae bacterium]|nr:ROK family protein [Anaerolineaceae bacterium]HUM48964.1 ROK family protein [Anaerolineaceae bacterium]